MEYLLRQGVDYDPDREHDRAFYERLDKWYTPSPEKIKKLERNLIRQTKNTLMGETKVSARLARKIKLK